MYSDKSVDKLINMISLLSSEEEIKALLCDLCTIKELQDMAQRFETALMLDAGENYQEISQKIGTSSATISRVNRCLNYGDGGYANAIAVYKKSLKDKAKGEK